MHAPVQASNSQFLPTSRRGTVFGLLTSLLTSRCCLTAPPPLLNADIPAGFVDAHCHVFNAHDLPVPQFMLETAMRETEQPEAYVILGSIIANLIKAWLTIADPEVLLAGQEARANITLPTREQEDQRFRDLLFEALRATADQAAVEESDRAPQSADPLDSTLRDVGNRRTPSIFKAQTNAGQAALNPEAASILNLLQRYGLRQSNTVKGMTDRARPNSGRAFQSLGSQVSDSDLRTIAKNLTGEADAGTDLGSVVLLAETITHMRGRNIADLDTSLGVAASKPERVRLYAPAMVDFDCWYSQRPSSLSLETQTKIMAALSKRQSNPNVFSHGYVAYDPLRMVLFEQGLLSRGPSPFEVVTQAIEHHGFLGVKVYPPMGFRPYGNSALPNEYYGDRAKGWIGQIVVQPGKDKFTLGPALDNALDRLYRWCLKNDIPIIAHCSDSQASFAQSGENADPKYWVDVLNRSDGGADGDFRNLRLNLGHAGSLWCHNGAQRSPGDVYSEWARCAAAAPWADTLISAIGGKRSDGQPAYPNLYCDLGDLGDVTDSTKADVLRTFLQSRPREEVDQLMSRMLYGTDWMFLVLYGKPYQTYINSVDSFWTHIVGASGDRLFHSNAIRFFNLTAQSPAFGRLKTFYSDNPARVSSLKTLCGIA